MATKLTVSESTDVMGKFERVESVIETTFSTLIGKLIEKRDRLLSELHDLKTTYLSREDARRKNISDLDQLIRQMEEAKIKQNPIVKLQEEQINRMKSEKEEYQKPTSVPFVHFDDSRLEELQRCISIFGGLQDVSSLYRTKLEPVRSIGKRGRGKVEFLNPCGIAMDKEENIFITNRASGTVQVVGLEGEFLGEFGKRELSKPHYMALYNEFVFVTDFHANKVFKYGNLNYKFDYKTNFKLKKPFGITVHDNEVLVADRDDHKIVVLSIDLKFIRELGEKTLKYPVDVKVNMNKVYVSHDNKPHNIQVISKSGDLLNSIVSLEDGTGDIYFCFDQFHNILISDSEAKTLQIYTTEGQLIHSIELEHEPTGVAVTHDNVIISVDCANDKIYLY